MMHRLPRVFCWVMAIVVVVALAGAFRVGLQRGFDHTIGVEAWGRMLFGIGGAITSMAHGRHGYVIASVVETVLQYGGLTGHPEILASRGLTFPANLQDAALIDAAIQKAVQFPIAASPVRGVSGDDPGMVDFVRIAFTLFGYNLLSLYLTYFVLFSMTVWAFFRSFRDRPACLAVLAVAVLAHLGVFVSGLLDLNGDTLGAPTNPRFLSVLAVIPALHLGLVMFLGLAASWRNAASTTLQAGMVVFAYWIRASAVWVPVALLILAMVISIRSRSLRSLWSFGLLAALWLIHGIYVTQALSPVYRQTGDISHHPIWHSIFYSLQFNPQWGVKYAAAYDGADGDELTTIAAKKYLERHPPRRPDKLYNPTTGTLKWTAIESTVRKEFFEIFRNDPQFVLATFFVHKPRYLISQLRAYMISIRRFSAAWCFFLTAVWLMMTAFFAASRRERRVFTHGAVLMAGAFLVSLVPIVLTVPYRTVIADQFFMLAIVVAAWGVAVPAFAIDAVAHLARSERRRDKGGVGTERPLAAPGQGS